MTQPSTAKTLFIPISRNIHKPETGFDSYMFALPDDESVDDPRFSLKLAKLAFDTAEQMGEGLRESHWWFTTDAEIIEKVGMEHDCPTCRAGTDQALASLEERPDRPVIVGRLSWCDR